MFNFSFFNKSSTFGLDIGYETLKIVELRKRENCPSLIGAIEVPLTERILEKDSFKNKESAAKMIKEACSKAKPNFISAKRIVSALPENFIFSKTIQMPKMKAEEYRNSVPVEAAGYLPIPIEEAYLDYQVLIVHPNEPLVDVLIVATPRKLVDDFVEVTKMAGLELVALETKPIAVGRAIGANQSLNGSVIAEIGTEVTRISIWDNNSIRLTTSASIGKNQISKALQGNLENAKKDKIDLNPEANLVLGTIAEEILNAIRYHQNRDYNPKPITKILLCGSGANIEGIDKIIEKDTKIKAEIIRPKIDNGKKILGPEFIISYGLALRNEEE